MRLAISNIAWDLQQEPQVSALLQRFGVEGVELAPTKIWPQPLLATAAEVLDYRRGWEGRGIGIVAFQALLFGRPELTIFESAEKRAQTLEYLGGIARLAQQLGARALIFGSPKNRFVGDLAPETAWAIAVDFFRRAGDLAAAHDAAFCIEPNPPEYGCDFVNNSVQAVELVKAVDSEGFRVHIDAGALAMASEQPERAIQNAVPWMNHFHISERNLSPIGTTGVDHAACAAALVDAGYRQWVSIEMRPPYPDRVEGIEGALTVAINDYAPFFQAHALRSVP